MYFHKVLSVCWQFWLGSYFKKLRWAACIKKMHGCMYIVVIMTSVYRIFRPQISHSALGLFSPLLNSPLTFWVIFLGHCRYLQAECLYFCSQIWSAFVCYLETPCDASLFRPIAVKPWSLTEFVKQNQKCTNIRFRVSLFLKVCVCVV